MKKFFARMGEFTVQSRAFLIGWSILGGTICMAVGLIDVRSYSAMYDMLMAGFMFCNAFHVWLQPGLRSTWREMEKSHIQEQMQQAFHEIVERHNEEVRHHGEIKH